MASVGGMQRVAMDLLEYLKLHPEVEISELLLRSSWRFHHIRCAPWLLNTLLEVAGIGAATSDGRRAVFVDGNGCLSTAA